MYQVVTGMINGLRFKVLYESKKVETFTQALDIYKQLRKNGFDDNEFMQILKYDDSDFIEVIHETKKINGSYKVSNWLDVIL